MSDNQLKKKMEKVTRAREENKDTIANKKVAWLLCGEFYSNYHKNKK